MQIGASVGPYVDRIPALPEEFAFAELAVGEGELPADEFDPAAVQERLAAGDRGLTVHLPYRQPLSTPVDRIDAATLEYLDGLLELAAEAGADRAVAHPSARGAGHEEERLVGALAALADRGEAHGVPVAFETTGYAGGLSLDRLGRVADAAGIAVCLDLGYAYLEAGADGVVDFLDARGDRVAHLHVHGARHRGDTHIPLGSGDLDLDVLGPALARTVPDATATIEVFTDDADYLRASADRLREALAADPAPSGGEGA